MRKDTHCTVETRKRMSEAHKGKGEGYVLDNRRTEPLYFNTLAEVCEFLGYKNIRGFKMGNAYHGYIITKSSKRTQEVRTPVEKY